MSAHTAPARAGRATAAAPSRRPARESSDVAKVALLGSLMLLLMLGLWGVLIIGLGEYDGNPRPGDAVDFEGGTLVVDAVHDVDLSLPMTGPAMKMGPSTGVPEIPEGYRWLSVDLSIGAPDGYLVDPDQFVVAVDGDRTAPVALDDGGTLIPAGAWLGRSFTYQVPEGTHQLQFWAPGADEPVSLTLGDAPESHHH